MGTGKRPFSVKEDCGGDLGCWELVDGREEGLGSCSEVSPKIFKFWTWRTSEVKNFFFLRRDTPCP